MATVSLITYRVKPGRMDDFMERTREAKRVVEGLATNLHSIRAFHSTVSGPNSGNVHVEFTYGNVADWGETFVREADDPGYNAMVARAMGPDAAAELVGRGIQTEIGPTAGSTTGSAMQAAIGKPKPGRMDEYLEHIGDINQLLTAHGASRVRHLLMSVAGTFTGNVVVLSEYPDMAALGQAWVDRSNDPAWGELVGTILGADGPMSLVSQSIVNELPL